ncbi:MAG: penicillin-binding protein 2 [Acidobacteriota bacterium]|nr:penicillin-binding protein 2 [Acidobacteriota bacterium]MDW3228526.1 penicillin-binding protein 2 [Acidobacteriota bacterium]
MSRIYEDLTVLIKRSKIILYILGAIFLLVLASYWKIQVLDHQKYWKMAEANRTRELPLVAPRGLILDRQQVILADNIPSFKLSLVPEAIDNYEKTIDNLSLLLELGEEELRKRIERYKFVSLYQPVVIKDNLKLEEVSLIEARKEEFPELKLEVEPKRNYPLGSTAAHLLGYLQEASADEIKANPDKQWRLGEMVGKSGLEKQYNDYLTGIEGKLVEMVDSRGRPIAEISRTEPLPGKSLVLSIDIDLQKKAEELLQGREGAIVILEPRTGECLALVSSPSFDPNRFITRFSTEEWLSIVNDPGKPLENRAIRGMYSPGSIFKIIMALAGLDQGLITENSTFFCSGALKLYGNVFSCWYQAGHGRRNLAEAIKDSCNVYFYQLGYQMDIDVIANYARKMGLGQKTNLDIPGEKDGLVPSSEWKRKTMGEPWYPGETISVSIGQGPLLVTPIQIACVTASLANRGLSVRPTLIKENRGELIGSRIQLPRETFEKVIEGMWQSVNNHGTGQGAFQAGLDICGKTGSTQLISRKTAEKIAGEEGQVAKTHSWFTGFAPRENPEIVVTVLVEYGGLGGQTAAPIAGQIFKAYRDKYVRPENIKGN